MRLLLVEGDLRAADNLARALRGHGFAVDIVDTGAELLTTQDRPDFVLLGLELVDLDGLEVCRRLRATRCTVPIIALSSRDSELDRVLGFQAGLDDYVTKPFEVRELVARIGAVMRRVRPSVAPTIPQQRFEDKTLTHGSLRIDLRTREVRVGSRRVSVTPKEFDLLALLASEPGTVFSRRRIMDRVWKDPASQSGPTASQSSRTIDTHVGALRAKLGARTWVVNVHGIGFRLGHE